MVPLLAVVEMRTRPLIVTCSHAAIAEELAAALAARGHQVVVSAGSGPPTETPAGGRPEGEDAGGDCIPLIASVTVPAEPIGDTPSADEFRLWFESASDAMFVLDAQSRVITCNEQASVLLGFDPDALRGMDLSQRVHPDDTARKDHDAAVRALLDGEVIRSRYRLRRADGAWLHTEVATRMLGPDRFLNVVRDVTAAVQMQEALRRSEQRLVDAQRIARMGDFSLRPDTGELAISEGLANLLGQSRDAILDLSQFCATAVHPDDRQRFEQWIADRAATSSPDATPPLELEMIQADGTRFDALVVGAVRHGDGQATVVGTVQDISFLRQAERALRREQERLRRLADVVPGAIVSIRQGADGGPEVVYASPAFPRIFGLSSDTGSVDPTLALSLIHPDDLPGIRSRMEEAVRTDTPCRFECRVRNPERGTVWVEAHFAPAPDDDGRTTWHGIVIDVTDRHDVERQQRELAARMEQLLATTSEAYLLADTAGQIVDANPAYCDLVGYTIDELRSMRVQEIEARLSPDGVRRRIDRMVRHGHDRFLTRHWTKDGRKLDLLVHAVVTRWEGRPLVAAFMRDVTRQREVEARLRLQATVLDQSTDLVLAADTTGRILYANQQAADFIGLPAEQVIGRNVAEFDVLHPDVDGPGIFETARSEGRWSGEFEATDATGRRRMLDLTLRVMDGHRGVGPDPDADGVDGSSPPAPEWVVVVARDATARKRSEEQARLVQQQLTRTRTMDLIGRLAGGVAHEFNNLLTAIMGNAELARSRSMAGSPDHELSEILSEIVEASRRGAELSAQLLTYSRRQLITPRVFTLDAAIGRYGSVIDAIVRDDIEVRLDLQAPTARVSMDPGQLQQALLNLITNAVDAMPTGGELAIHTEVTRLDIEACPCCLQPVHGEFLALSVEDSGTGIDPSIAERIFEPFFSTRGPGNGAGLGLSTVQGIARQNEGHITVDSVVGRGSRFTL
ncbi:MAG: PAS domain S-box protein, partial [Deltaproteobacteria bacterium]